MEVRIRAPGRDRRQEGGEENHMGTLCWEGRGEGSRMLRIGLRH